LMTLIQLKEINALTNHTLALKRWKPNSNGQLLNFIASLFSKEPQLHVGKASDC